MGRRGAAPATRPATALGQPLRLDRLENPFGPSIQVFEALSEADSLNQQTTTGERRLRERLARYAGVDQDRLVMANGMDELLDMILLWKRETGPVLLFPPTDASHRRVVERHGVSIIEHHRTPEFDLDLVGHGSTTVPARCTALVQSPNDPSGTILAVADAVCLARACETVVIDERHVEYAGRSLLPVAQEFENVIIARGFENWAGLSGLPFAYAIAPKRLGREIQSFLRPSGIATAAAMAAAATLDDISYMLASVRRVRHERTRLWRVVRKLNMVTAPYPTWSNFILIRVERGDAGLLAQELARRSVMVHRPLDESLAARHLRITATTPEQTETLKQALIDIAANGLD